MSGGRGARQLSGWVGLGVMWCAVGSSSAEIVPRPGATDARIRVIDYDAEQVIRLRGFVGYQIHLQFEDGEQFVNLAAGDLAALDVGAQGPHVMLKPKVEKLGTNLTLLTDRRVYHFDYSATRSPGSPTSPEVIYSLRFRYPEAKALAYGEGTARESTAAVVPTADGAPGVELASINRAYRLCGTRRVRPLRVEDDGVRTYLYFGARVELPAIFIRQADRSESLANFTVEPERIVVHRVAERFTLRRGRESACVINQAFAGGALRVPSGTVLPGSARVLDEAAP